MHLAGLVKPVSFASVFLFRNGLTLHVSRYHTVDYSVPQNICSRVTVIATWMWIMKITPALMCRPSC